MKVHEYQGKEIFRKHGIITPEGIPAFSVDESLAAYDKLDQKRLWSKPRYTQVAAAKAVV